MTSLLDMRSTCRPTIIIQTFCIISSLCFLKKLVDRKSNIQFPSSLLYMFDWSGKSYKEVPVCISYNVHRTKVRRSIPKTELLNEYVIVLLLFFCFNDGFALVHERNPISSDHNINTKEQHHTAMRILFPFHMISQVKIPVEPS